MEQADPTTLETLFTCGFGLLVIVAMGYIWWRIMARTGHSPVLGLLMLVPLVNIVLLLWLAFGEWPVQKRVRELESGEGLVQRFE